MMRDRFNALLRSVGALLALLSFCVPFVLEYIGAVYTPHSRIMQRLSIPLLIFWSCAAMIFGIRTLLRRRCAAKSNKKKESP